MINHARTLLINVPGTSSQRQFVGEEYIPPDYVPVALPSHLLLPRRVLFGSAPDRYFLNFRAQEVMRYLHETELQEFVYRLDPRVTYWPTPAAPFFDPTTKISIEQTAGAKGSVLNVQGQPVALNGAGRSLREYAVSIEAGSVTIALVDETPEAVTAPLTLTNNLSQPVPLPKSNMWLTIGNPQNGVRWTAKALAKPAPAITTLLPTLEILGEPLFLALFGISPVEPYATFKNLWFDHPSPVHRMGGLVLAVIYRTEELRSRSRGTT